MSRRLTTEEFIERAKQIHGNKYDYSKVEYRTAKEKVCIICPIHGEFWQEANRHLLGSGCILCGFDSAKNKKRDTKEDFIKKAKAVHGDKYDYSESEYISNHTKVKIICPIHGPFYQTPAHHKSGEGCPKCGKILNFSYAFRYGMVSKGEKAIMKWLSENNINYLYDIPMEIYDHMLIRVDFILDNNVYIEYNGRQHYLYNSYFHSSELDFLKQLYRDKKLRDYCNEHGITLIEIRYDLKVEEVLEKEKEKLINTI